MLKNLRPESKFNFDCHDKLACFKHCCRDINIFLTPFDVLRMKNKLGLTSQDFLERHTHVLKVPGSGFPVVVLKMREEDLVCPFISDIGCQVYQERPWSCRMAPVEIRGRDEYGFAFEPSRCHGLKEARQWTVEEWMKNQGLELYKEPENLFNTIPLKIKPTGNRDLDGFIMDMIFTACYNLDSFRNLLSKHPEVISQDPVIRENLLQGDDVNLMKFSFKWLLENFTELAKVKRLKEALG